MLIISVIHEENPRCHSETVMGRYLVLLETKQQVLELSQKIIILTFDAVCGYYGAFLLHFSL
jgi:hypothetical protein